MADEHEQPEKVWDEYDWERFLREQDLRTERYLELLERYADHPERDELIAKEMGWVDMEGEEESFWDDIEGEDSPEELELEDWEELEDAADQAEVHPLYQASFELTIWLDEALQARGKDAYSHPAAIELSHQASIMGGKLAAALSDPESAELGMTIAYLKRALREVTMALGLVKEVGRELLLSEEREVDLSRRLFRIRDGIIVMMGECRAMWRRRKGGG